MRQHQKVKFERIMFDNRWARPVWNRSDNWTVIGIHIHWFSPKEFEYHLCFFGFRIRIWMIREPIQPKDQQQAKQ